MPQSRLIQPTRPLAARSLVLAIILVATFAFALIPKDAGQLEAAIATQRARVALDPNAIELNDLANLLVVNGKLVEAEAVYREALSLVPEGVEVPYNLALLLQHLGKNAEALKLFRKVVQRVPDAAWAHLQIGVISADNGKRKRAVSAFAKAFALEPRLASSSINPHLRSRPEVLEAILKISSNKETPQTAPLAFSSPDRIARILVGESAAARAAARSVDRRGLLENDAEPSTSASSAAAQPALAQSTRAGIESLPETDTATKQRTSPPSPHQDLELPTSEEVQEPASTQPMNATAPSPERRRVGNQDLREVRGAGVNGTARSKPSRPTRAPRASPTRRPSESSPGTSRGGNSRFRPGTRSSARLELHTAPAKSRPTSRWAATATPGH